MRATRQGSWQRRPWWALCLWIITLAWGMAVVGSLLCLVSWNSSAWEGQSYYRFSWFDGILRMDWIDASPNDHNARWRFVNNHGITTQLWRKRYWFPSWKSDTGSRMLTVPAWMGVVPLAVLSIVLTKRPLHRGFRNCPRCQYDCSTIAAGRCPECGHKTLG